MNDRITDDLQTPQTANRSCHPGQSEASSVSSDINKTLLRPPCEAHPLAKLRRFTPARIAMGRTGSSLPIKELLDFNLAHALARDAVHTTFNASSIIEQLAMAHLHGIHLRSSAEDRTTYLRRPDLGRKLSEESRTKLAAYRPENNPEIVFIIADGLSTIAPHRYAVPVIEATHALMEDWKIGPVILVEQARVAIADEIGELLRSEIAVVLIGERPGLSSPDSLGIYLTYGPRVGRSDAERNCISNVRLEGTTPQQAAQTLHYLLVRSRKLQVSGVNLKDDSRAKAQ